MAWADAAVICPWQLYQAYGDKTLLREHLPMMQKWVEYVRKAAGDGCIWNTGHQYGDWLALDAGEDNYTGASRKEFIATAFYAHSAQLLADTTAGHGRSDYDTGYALLTLTLRLLNEECTLPFYTDEVVSETLRRIWNDYASPLHVSELAAAVHLEENHFIRRFRRAMGQTPYAYLRTYRLALAKQALASGNTLTQAAEKVGYQNAASLSRALRAAEP